MSDRVELTDAEFATVPHLSQLDSYADARDIKKAVERLLAAHVQALTAERDGAQRRADEGWRLAREREGQRDTARASCDRLNERLVTALAELAAANARCAELEAQGTKLADGLYTWKEESLALQATLDRVTALADEPHEELRAAVAEVYRRHDSNAPLNHVNNVEWVEAVESVLRAALTPEGKP